MSVLIQFPTLGRPDKFIRVLNKYVNQASGHWADAYVQPVSLFFNINCDADDASMNNAAMRHRIKEVFESNPLADYQIHYDKDTDKISAINSHINGLDFDIVVCASDDMVPQVDNWDFEIADAMRQHFPKLDGCVHFNDGHTDGKLITFSILGRELYKHFGYVYHPDYKSLYCDNEFTQEVTRMDKVKYIDKVIVKHEHYGEEGNENSGDFDYAAQKTLHYSGRDGQVFELRQSKGFPKERVTLD
jgi:hypothetical protein